MNKEEIKEINRTYLPNKIVDQLQLPHTGPHLEFMTQFKQFIPYDGIVVEVGTYVGFFANLWATGDRKVFCIDTWDDEDRGEESRGNDSWQKKHKSLGGAKVIFETCLRNCGEDLYRKVFPIRGPSDLISKYWQTPIDLVYIDACHKYESVKQDIMCWWDKIKMGGIMCGDDFDPSWGVYQAVNEIFPDRQVPFNCFWLVIKNEKTCEAYDRWVKNHKEEWEKRHEN